MTTDNPACPELTTGSKTPRHYCPDFLLRQQENTLRHWEIKIKYFSPSSLFFKSFAAYNKRRFGIGYNVDENEEPVFYFNVQ